MSRKLIALATLFLAIILVSCEVTESTQPDEITDVTLAQISRLGFNTDNVVRTDGGYLVEGDIILHDHDLASSPDAKTLRIAEVEQYHTFNLVTGLPRTITVSVSGSVNTGFSNAVNNAIARYNAENLGITMSRVSSGGNINIRIVNTGQYIASAGFPSSDGNPYPEIKYAKKYTSGYSDGFMTTVIAHELGHCIGFRHTDYMNRSYSCGSGGNEGQETTGVGAVHIPGTPTGPDAASWMLACLSSSTDRPFNSNDKIALDYLY
jgi:putative lipoic acid-binding regulatory protein